MSLEIARRLIAKPATAKNLHARFATYCAITDAAGQVIDHGIVLSFPAPASYSGEDVVEFHGHGSPIVMKMLIRACLQCGAEMARPGEFSERAFLNGRLDLTQAEAVADLIDSHTDSAARAALKSLQGEFSVRVHELTDAITELRVFVEAAIDFPDEEIDFLASEDVVGKLARASSLFAMLRASIKQGKILRDGLKVVLTGPPNAGKSSLLNVLSREDRAIVSDIPGTTRDILEQFITLDGLPIEIVDSAGIRDGTDEIEVTEIEYEGMRRAMIAQKAADLVLLVVDDVVASSQQIDEMVTQVAEGIPMFMIRNKIDVSGGAAGKYANEISHEMTHEMTHEITHEAHETNVEIGVSAHTGQGIDDLKVALKEFAGFRDNNDNIFIARERHIQALDQAEAFLQQGLSQYVNHQAGELLAEDLLCCQKSLGQITGEVSSDDLLGLIFGSFCIGK